MSDDFNHADWISAAEAARMVRSPRGGRTHVSTIHRWIGAGLLEGRRRGRWWFVRVTEVEALALPRPVPRVAEAELPEEMVGKRERARRERAAKEGYERAVEVLKRFGIG